MYTHTHIYTHTYIYISFFPLFPKGDCGRARSFARRLPRGAPRRDVYLYLYLSTSIYLSISFYTHIHIHNSLLLLLTKGDGGRARSLARWLPRGAPRRDAEARLQQDRHGGLDRDAGHARVPSRPHHRRHRQRHHFRPGHLRPARRPGLRARQPVRAGGAVEHMRNLYMYTSMNIYICICILYVCMYIYIPSARSKTWSSSARASTHERC